MRRFRNPLSDLNRGIMRFDGADSPATVTLSSLIILGSIVLLILWAMRNAYLLG
ncbi:hypothetical protein [Alkalinema sp. FACHB-956]|uniref:hypothetical protein n=1 Tax=Alkalinema sp. FACHB-956 TaxID=2692768 RepID=UPI001685C0B6|nr:hypothetical protein [Alkalinema sp. FACHB-956]MBD2326738.1 hypothetical protein [Alkalinema sp. FACHB-956]